MESLLTQKFEANHEGEKVVVCGGMGAVLDSARQSAAWQ